MNPTQPKQASGYRGPVAGFGAALSTLVVAPNVDATIIPLTADPGTVPYLATTFPRVFSTVNLNVGVERYFYFYQANDAYAKGWFYGDIFFQPVSFSSTITTGQGGWDYYRQLGSTGTVTYAFLDPIGNRVGWFRMDLGGPGGPITYLGAAFNNRPGGAIGAGKFVDPTAVPEPETLPLVGLGLLAMGAAGVRRLRRRRAAPAEAGSVS